MSETEILPPDVPLSAWRKAIPTMHRELEGLAARAGVKAPASGLTVRDALGQMRQNLGLTSANLVPALRRVLYASGNRWAIGLAGRLPWLSMALFPAAEPPPGGAP